MTPRKKEITDPRKTPEWVKKRNAQEDCAALALNIETDASAIPYIPGTPAAAVRLAGNVAINAQKLRQRVTEHERLTQELKARTTPADTDAVHNRRKEDHREG